VINSRGEVERERARHRSNIKEQASYTQKQEKPRNTTKQENQQKQEKHEKDAKKKRERDGRPKKRNPADAHRELGPGPWGSLEPRF
jgi:hypothetical protein